MARSVILEEERPQRYRAVALFKNGKQGLITLGSTEAEVRNLYDDAFMEMFGEQIGEIQEVEVQKWNGRADCGVWQKQKPLPIPAPVALPVMIRRKPA